MASTTTRQLDPVALLAERFQEAARRAFADLDDEAEPLITPSRRADLGDFQSNMAMPLGKRLGKNPREVAQAIVEHLDPGELIEPLDATAIAGPGFINVRLRPAALAGLLEALDTPRLGVEPPTTVETVAVDLVGVNLAKQMHVGHLRSMIIGDAIARLLTRLGHTVVRQNHVGDWGLPIAMVTHRVLVGQAAGEIDLDRLTLDDLDRLYREAQNDCAPDRRGLEAVQRFGLGPKATAELEEQVAGAEEALAEAKATLRELQAQEPATMAVWRRLVEITLGECLAVCRRLDVLVSEDHSAGESSYREELGPLVEDLLERGVAEVDRGAVVVRVEGHAQPCLIRKSDGGYLYATTDVAGIRRRVRQLGADRVIYCVDARQGLHFELAFGAAIKAGYANREGAEGPSRLEHAAFGMVLGEDQRPFKTRSGENVKLSALLDEAERRAREVVGAKNPELSEAERAPIARAVAIAAIKYADLSSERARDYIFSFDRMLAFEGNTGPYLLYALVRIKSIFRRAGERGISTDLEGAEFQIAEAAERQLALQLLKYPEVLRAAGETLEPHRICGYLYDLATAFSGFFDACPVLGAEDEGSRRSRLRLCRLVERVLEDALRALGIPTLERM